MTNEFNLSEKIKHLDCKGLDGTYTNMIQARDIKEFIRLIIKDINNVVNFEDYQKKWLIDTINKRVGDKLKEDKGK